MNINIIASLSVVRTGFSKEEKVSKFSKKSETNLVSTKTGSVIFRFTVGFIEINENTFMQLIDFHH